MGDPRFPELENIPQTVSLPPEVLAARGSLDRMAEFYRFPDKKSLYQLMAACHNLGVVRSALNEYDSIKQDVQTEIEGVGVKRQCLTTSSKPPRPGKTAGAYYLEVQADINRTSKISEADAKILALKRALPLSKEYIDEQTQTYNLMNGVNNENPQGPKIGKVEMEALRRKRMEIKYKKHGRLSDEEFSELCRIVRDYPGKIEDLGWLIEDVVDKSREDRPSEQIEYLIPYLTSIRNALALIRPFIGQVDDSNREIFKLLIAAYQNRPELNLNEELFRSFCGAVFSGYDLDELFGHLRKVKMETLDREIRVTLFNEGLRELPKG